jgi:hypothetical protein
MDQTDEPIETEAAATAKDASAVPGGEAEHDEKREIPEEAKAAILVNLVELLSMAVRIMEDKIEKPKFLDPETPLARFRFENPTPNILQVLMCARVASGLRAALILLMEAHTTEIGVLFRTIDDFLADINFIDEILEKGAENVTQAQREFVELYFVDDARTIEERLEDSVKKINHNARRQKVQASEARLLGFGDPDRVKKIAATIDKAFSGYIHGDYQTAMEMYGGPNPHFHTHGMPVRFTEYRRHIGIYVHRALNEFCGVAHKLGLEELAYRLREMRREFEKSPAYVN